MLKVSINPSGSHFITGKWCTEQVKGVLQFLLYHRLQIPVPYKTLQLLVAKIQNDDQKDATTRTNFFMEKQRRLAVDTYEGVQRIANDWLENHLIRRRMNVEFAAIAFGPTLTLSKEIWFIRLPQIDRDHLDENHLDNLQRTVTETILSIVADSTISTVLESSLPLTNIHLLLRGSAQTTDENSEEASWFQWPKSCKTFLIDLDTKQRTGEQQQFISCSCVETEFRIFDDQECGLETQCSELKISEEVEVKLLPTERVDSLTELTSGGMWFRSEAIKGFHDVLSNGQKIWTW